VNPQKLTMELPIRAIKQQQKGRGRGKKKKKNEQVKQWGSRGGGGKRGGGMTDDEGLPLPKWDHNLGSGGKGSPHGKKMDSSVRQGKKNHKPGELNLFQAIGGQGL